MLKCFAKKVVLWMLVAGLMLTGMVGCRNKPADGSEISISSSVSSGESEASAAPLLPDSSAEPPVSEEPVSEVSSQTQSPSEEVTPIEEINARILDCYNCILLIFKPECITTKEEMTHPDFFPELDKESIHSIEWTHENDYYYDNYSTVEIRFNDSFLNDDSRKEIRASLMKRKDLLKIWYSVWAFIITDPTVEIITSFPPEELPPKTTKSIMIPPEHILSGAWDGWLYLTNREDPKNEVYYRLQASTGKTEELPSLPPVPVRSDGFVTDPPFSSQGLFGIQDDWVYYRGGTQLFGTDQPDGWKYGGCYVARKRLDGTGEQKLGESNGAESGKVYGDWVYYYDQKALRRVRTDGTETQMLVETPYCDTYTVGEQGIFFEEKTDQGLYGKRIMRCDLDGSNLTTVWHEPDCSDLIILFNQNGYLYFAQYYDKTQKKDGFYGTKIVRTYADGSQCQPIAQCPEQGLDWENVKLEGEWLYYIKRFRAVTEEKTAIYRAPIWFGEEQQLGMKRPGFSWELVDGYLYYVIRGENKQDVRLWCHSRDSLVSGDLYQQSSDGDTIYHGYIVEDDVVYLVLTQKEKN